MHSTRSAFSDLKLALTIGALAELLLGYRSFAVAGELTGWHPWLRISQAPGALIAERLFRYVGVSEAILFTVLFQGLGFTIIILGLLYCYRMFQAARRTDQRLPENRDTVGSS
jgi:hypothetical protein